jgi:hypothetical protein
VENQDSNRFKAAMTNISIIYDIKMDAQKASAWWEVLKRFSIDQVEQAIADHISDPDQGMFAPKPAHIIKQIEGTSKDQEQSAEQLAEMAWAKILHEIGRIGAYGSLDMDDKIALMAVKAVGGWQKLCHSATDDLNWRKKEFFESYKVYQKTDPFLLPDHLSGIIESTNNRIGGNGAPKAIQDLSIKLDEN